MCFSQTSVGYLMPEDMGIIKNSSSIDKIQLRSLRAQWQAEYTSSFLLSGNILLALCTKHTSQLNSPPPTAWTLLLSFCNP